MSHSVGLGTIQCARDKKARQSIWFLNWGHLELFCLPELELLVCSAVLWKADDLGPLADVPWLSRCWWSPSDPIPSNPSTFRFGRSKPFYVDMQQTKTEPQDESGWMWIKRMKVDESGWKYLRCYMHFWGLFLFVMWMFLQI